jgi:hypothetical protein
VRAACLVLLLAGPAAAQTPFLTDDAAVAPSHGAHFEWSHEFASLSKADLPAQHQYTAVFDIKWGILPGVEFGFDIPLLQITGSTLDEAHGLGDLDFSAKAVLLEEKEGSARPSVAFSVAVELPTGDTNGGLGSGRTDVVFNAIVAKSLGAGWSVTGNLGLVLTGNTLTGAEGIAPTKGSVLTFGACVKKQWTETFLAGVSVWGARATSANAATGSELRAQLGLVLDVGRGVSIVAAGTAGWHESSRAAGSAGVVVDF